MVILSDEALWRLLIEDARLGWRAFVDQYTSVLLALIERAGVAGRDDVVDVYVRVCERLAEDDCARLRRYDPAGGALAAWLTTVVRHVVIDWVRSRAGRRRLFGAIRRLDRFDQLVFELYYWEQRPAAEIAGLLRGPSGEPVSVADVLEALARIDRTLSDRHRGQLLALLARSRKMSSLDSEVSPHSPSLADARSDPEHALRVRRLNAAFAEALADLPAEDAAIIRLMFGQGWARQEIERALHLAELTHDRIKRILEELRALLAVKGIRSAEAVGSELTFLNGSAT